MDNPKDSAKACARLEARLEDHLEGLLADAPAVADDELAAHLATCTACREAVEEARWGSDILRAGREPLPESLTASPFFAARVAAHIRADRERAELAGEFWPALESLALRLTGAALSATLLLAAWAAWGGIGARRPALETTRTRPTEVRSLFPEAVRQPANADEVMLTLVSADDGRQR